MNACGSRVAASQGQLTVPSPADGRPPTDWERNVTARTEEQWITADMAYRRTVLEALRGFDERFTRPYREDTELGLRTVETGFQIVSGSRHVTQPVSPAPWHVSLSEQAGNADDALMYRLHCPGWQSRAGRGWLGVRSKRFSSTGTAPLCATQAGLPVAVVSNQSDVAPGLIDPDQVDAVNSRVSTMLGPFDAWFVCPHDDHDDCECRTPRPDMVLKTAAKLGVAPEHCALVGDTGADMEAALAAGAVPILVPTERTRVEDITTAPAVVSNLSQATDLVQASREADR